MDLLIQTMVSGLALGASYGLVAVGLTFVFGIGKIVNFAHGEFAMVAAYLMVIALSNGLPWVLAMILAVVGVCLMAWLLEVTVIARGLYGAHEHASIIATFALSLILANGALLLFGTAARRAESPLTDDRIDLFGAGLDGQRAFTAVVSLAALVALTYWLRASRLGLQMQAVSQNPQGALYSGINVRLVRRVAFVLGVGLAGVAGALVAPTMTAYPSMGQTLVVTAFTVVILGGLGSVKGAAYGGIMIGLMYAVVATYVSVQWTTAFGWLLVVVVLLLRPQGLFGERPVRA
jgi:branched-chain amino acid transport system permease protein